MLLLLLLLLLRRSRRSVDRGRFGFSVDGRFATKHVLAVMDQVEQIARFRFAAPSSQILSANFSTRIDVGTLADGHVRCRRHKCHGRFAWIISWDPVRYGDIVRSVAEVDRDGTVQSE